MLNKGADHTTIAMHDQPARKPLSSGVNRVTVTATGQREFAIIIPHDWSNEKLLKFLQAPTKNPNVPYPTWEVPARVHGRPVLFELEDTSGESVARAGRSSSL
jgi:hypothetical protein